MVYGDRMKLLFRRRKVHFVKGRFGLRKEDLVYEKKVMSQKGRFCLRKEGFIFVYSFALAYICYEINKLRNEDFCQRKEGFIYGRPPWRGRFGRRSRRNSYDFALSVREGEDDFALFFRDFRNLLSVLLAPVSRFFACLQQTLTVALMIANGDTPTTTRCLQKHDIITLIGNYP